MDSPKTYTITEAIKKLEKYCAFQERCHKEVRQKLFDLKIYYEDQDHVINHLLENNYLNETRFAQAYARGKFNIKKWGKIRIIRELKLRDISKFNIKIALREIPESEYFKTFDSLIEKRLMQLASEKNIPKKKKKLADYLFYRGWESELVYEKIDELIKL